MNVVRIPRDRNLETKERGKKKKKKKREKERKKETKWLFT
jgi:hypothetical protein